MQLVKECLKLEHLCCSIREAVKRGNRAKMKVEAVIDSTFKIMQNPLNCKPMSSSRLMHKLANLVDRIGNIKLSKGQIL